MNKDYSKIVYRSEPIGKERITLVLTTLDLDKFKEDESLTKIPEKKVAIDYTFEKGEFAHNMNLIKEIQQYHEDFIKKTYSKTLEEMQAYIERLRQIKMIK